MGRTGKNFLASFRSEEKGFLTIIKNELGKKLWNHMFPDGSQRKDVVRAPAEIVGMCHRLKQTLFGVCGIRKNAARDCLFEALGYEMLKSRSSASTAE